MRSDLSSFTVQCMFWNNCRFFFSSIVQSIVYRYIWINNLDPKSTNSFIPVSFSCCFPHRSIVSIFCIKKWKTFDIWIETTKKKQGEIWDEFKRLTRLYFIFNYLTLFFFLSFPKNSHFTHPRNKCSNKRLERKQHINIILVETGTHAHTDWNNMTN